jgi:hypothetical protein
MTASDDQHIKLGIHRKIFLRLRALYSSAPERSKGHPWLPKRFT